MRPLILSFSIRSLPVETSSVRAPRTVDVSAALLADTDTTGSTRTDLEALFDLPGPHLYRDPLGRVMYGTLSPLLWSRDPGGYGGLSFSITRSDRGTDTHLAGIAGSWTELG